MRQQRLDDVPKRDNLFAATPTSFNASTRVYGLSLFALRRGLKTPSRNDRRVNLLPMRLMELMVVGSVELSPIYRPSIADPRLSSLDLLSVPVSLAPAR